MGHVHASSGAVSVWLLILLQLAPVCASMVLLWVIAEWLNGLSHHFMPHMDIFIHRLRGLDGVFFLVIQHLNS